MNRTILHVDLNNYYASVECLYQPKIRDKPVVVCGDVEARHGIILAKNYIAKALGVKTGEAIWEAKQRCPGLILVRADFSKYLRFSRLARAIYADYTNLIEPFGIDEAWLDVSGAEQIFGTGPDIANTIRQRLRDELGVTGSVGVSYNKIFAKLGSDMQNQTPQRLSRQIISMIKYGLCQLVNCCMLVALLGENFKTAPSIP